MEYQIIYQYCLHNNKDEFTLLSRVKDTLKEYKSEMMDLENHTYNLDFFKNENISILGDIIPHFLTPIIYEFNFNDYLSENEIMEDVTSKTLQFVKESVDPEITLVIQLIHSFESGNE